MSLCLENESEGFSMLRLGVIGHGRRLSGVIKRYMRKAEPNLRVVGIVDPNREYAISSLEECDKTDVVFYKTVKEMMHKGKLDAIAIGTRCDLHTPYALEVAKYDIPLYLEKPVSINMDQALALEDAFGNSQCKVVVGFPLVVSRLAREARRLIDDGTIGSPEHIMSWTYPATASTNYFDRAYRDYRITQGLFIQKATHDFNYIEYLMGSPIINIAARWTLGHIWGGDKPANLRCSQCEEQETCLESPRNRKNNRTTGVHHDHMCVFGRDIGNPKEGMNEDSSSALFELASGVNGVHTQVFFVRNEPSRGARISGYHGNISFDWHTSKIDVIHHHKPFCETFKAGPEEGHYGGDFVLGQSFIDLVHGKTDPPEEIGINAGIQSIYICLAAKESARNGTFVNVRRIGDMGPRKPARITGDVVATSQTRKQSSFLT